MTNGRHCKLSKDDGCNTKLISEDFIRKNENSFKVVHQEFSIKHLNEDSFERADGVVVDAIAQIEKHHYQSN